MKQLMALLGVLLFCGTATAHHRFGHENQFFKERIRSWDRPIDCDAMINEIYDLDVEGLLLLEVYAKELTKEKANITKLQYIKNRLGFIDVRIRDLDYLLRYKYCQDA